jgi:hypothetical protein
MGRLVGLDAFGRGTAGFRDQPLDLRGGGAGFDRIEDLEEALPPQYFTREPLPWAAAFLAARAFLSYRRRGGNRPAPLPDFFIGAHAAVAGYTFDP